MLLIALQRFDEIRPGIQHKHKKEAEWEADYLIHRVVYGLAFLGSDFPGMSEQQQVVCRPPRVCASGALARVRHPGIHWSLGKARELT
jgi:hypothetical protein